MDFKGAENEIKDDEIKDNEKQNIIIDKSNKLEFPSPEKYSKSQSEHTDYRMQSSQKKNRHSSDKKHSGVKSHSFVEEEEKINQTHFLLNQNKALHDTIKEKEQVIKQLTNELS